MIIHYDKYPFNLKHILKKSKKGACPFFSGCPWGYKRSWSVLVKVDAK